MFPFCQRKMEKMTKLMTIALAKSYFHFSLPSKSLTTFSMNIMPITFYELEINQTMNNSPFHSYKFYTSVLKGWVRQKNTYSANQLKNRMTVILHLSAENLGTNESADLCVVIAMQTSSPHYSLFPSFDDLD